MQVDIDLAGRRVVVVGTANGTRRAVAKLSRAGARLTVAVTDASPMVRADGVRYVGAPAAEDTSGWLRLLGPAWMLVTVDAPTSLGDRVRDLAAHLKVVTTTQPPAAATGQVTLVGGGPGRAGLLTLDAVEALAGADVVFFDRLAPTDDLSELAPGAELVDVGKSPYHHKVDQRSIEDLMIERARAGQSVVRLKGGDPFVFGRGGEEVRACLAAGVRVRVVPGISSAVAVPATAGIPVTHRGLSHAYTVVSGHQAPSEEELDGLVRLGGTVVVLMGVVNLEQIAAGLLRAGMDAATPAAVVERGYSDSQRTTLSRLGSLAQDARRLQVLSPAVVVIGAVVDLAAELGDAVLALDDRASGAAGVGDDLVPAHEAPGA